MLLIASLIIVKKWKRPKRPSVDEAVNKMYKVYLYNGIFFNSKKKQMKLWYKLQHGMMNLENITLSERNKIPKFTYYMIHLYEMLRIGKSVGIENKSMTAWGWNSGTNGE